MVYLKRRRRLTDEEEEEEEEEEKEEEEAEGFREYTATIAYNAQFDFTCALVCPADDFCRWSHARGHQYYDSRSDTRSVKVRNWSDEKTLGDRGHFDTKSTPAALVLDNVRATDEGLYRCRVDFQKSPTRNARTNVSVIIPPNSPTILSENGLQVYTTVGPYDEGATMTLICNVKGGKPPPQVTWWMDRKLVDDTSESTRLHSVSNTLKVEGLARRHLHATLTCKAFSNTNYSDPVSTSIAIEMNFKPLSVKILGSLEPLSSGKEYELVCQSVGARPAASLTWWLDGVQLNNATTSTASSGNVTLSTLTFVPNENDGGKYLKCQAESPVIHHTPLEDQWLLEVYYTPQVYLAMGSNLSPEDIKEGDDVYFECNVRANPWVYKVVWYHNGVQVQHNVSGGVIVSNQSLVIQRVRRQQAGLYTCVASNIEGDGQSNAVILQVQYAPVCAEEQTHVYGAARHEEVSVTCRLDAVPPVVHFYWRFNSSGDVVDIAESHVASQGLESSLSYVARTELDYGTLLCWGSNSLGRQRKPCVYKVVPAGPPDPPDNCSLTNQTTEALRVKCMPGYDGGLDQRYIIETYESDTGRLLVNITETSTPDFTIRGLEPGASYHIYVYSANIKGISDKKYLQGYTLRDVAERRTAQVRPPPEEMVSFTPILAVIVGVVVSLVLVALVAVLIVSLNKKKRPRNKNVAGPLQTSLADNRDLDDKNPDLIPANVLLVTSFHLAVAQLSPFHPPPPPPPPQAICGLLWEPPSEVPPRPKSYLACFHFRLVSSSSAPSHLSSPACWTQWHFLSFSITRNGEPEGKSPTTPEEGGFGSVHICASVPYPSPGNVYGTYPRTPRTMAPSSPQNGELMYAELSFPRGAPQYPQGTIPRRKPEPTIYAQIDHGLGPVPVSMGVVPVSGMGGSVVGTLGGTMACNVGTGSMCHTAPMVSSGLCSSPTAMMGMSVAVDPANLSVAYTTPAPPPHGFGGNPLTPPPVVPEEDEQPTAETPLMNNHKESEV
ncbi:neural cell adhesion molecule 2-like [Macrobrachium rosenbergii]|uniref:neural cell adhesion molecule 2-like n=1 Tax=Macrobrachium rosenbergii TaxID=79674 RepID=UPI0034D5F29F